ncbi:hypothetical protein [Mycetocola spongiae]|uniref:hypothetical protein n=1 Tax=Mycetocola spongiae TaxID=2859226 RepID=UPI001CF411AE|nr:hypothetical protein [Mycetocola spongiae]UCR89064.1 hypothetical protein KXZ72_14150 [Mycetocola spongiae]
MAVKDKDARIRVRRPWASLLWMLGLALMMGLLLLLTLWVFAMIWRAPDLTPEELGREFFPALVEVSRAAQTEHPDGASWLIGSALAVIAAIYAFRLAEIAQRQRAREWASAREEPEILAEEQSLLSDGLGVQLVAAFSVLAVTFFTVAKPTGLVFYLPALALMLLLSTRLDFQFIPGPELSVRRAKDFYEEKRKRFRRWESYTAGLRVTRHWWARLIAAVVIIYVAALLLQFLAEGGTGTAAGDYRELLIPALITSLLVIYFGFIAAVCLAFLKYRRIRLQVAVAAPARRRTRLLILLLSGLIVAVTWAPPNVAGDLVLFWGVPVLIAGMLYPWDRIRTTGRPGWSLDSGIELYHRSAAGRELRTAQKSLRKAVARRKKAGAVPGTTGN